MWNSLNWEICKLDLLSWREITFHWHSRDEVVSDWRNDLDEKFRNLILFSSYWSFLRVAQPRRRIKVVRNEFYLFPGKLLASSGNNLDKREIFELVQFGFCKALFITCHYHLVKHCERKCRMWCDRSSDVRQFCLESPLTQLLMHCYFCSDTSFVCLFLFLSLTSIEWSFFSR